MNVEKLIEESLGIEGSGELEDDSDDDVGGMNSHLMLIKFELTSKCYR